MRRFVPLATFVAVVAVTTVLLRRSDAPTPASTVTDAPPPHAAWITTAASTPTAAPTATPAERGPMSSAALPSPAAAADGAALRAEADRLIAAGKVIEGIDVFRKVVEAAPTAKNHGDLGSLLYRLTAFDESARHLRAAAELDPGNADRWIALANAYYRKVDPGAAWKAEKRAREAEPGLELGRDADGMRIRK